MNKRPRGTCPECGEGRALTTSGRIWAHTTWQLFTFGAAKDLCSGTGRHPRENKA